MNPTTYCRCRVLTCQAGGSQTPKARYEQPNRVWTFNSEFWILPLFSVPSAAPSSFCGATLSQETWGALRAGARQRSLAAEGPSEAVKIRWKSIVTCLQVCKVALLWLTLRLLLACTQMFPDAVQVLRSFTCKTCTTIEESRTVRALIGGLRANRTPDR